MPLENSVTAHHLQQVMSDADAAVANFDRFESFALSMKR